MTPTVLAILASAFVNALAVIAANGIRRDLKSLRELMEAKHDALDDRLQKVEKFKEDFISSKLSKGAHA